MRRSLSTRLLVSQRLTPALLDHIAKAGFDEVELHLDRRHLDYHDRAQIDALRRHLPDSDLDTLSLRAPVYSNPARTHDSVIAITSRDKAVRIRAVDEIKRALEIGDAISFRYFVLPFGAPDDDFDPHKIDAAFTSLDELHVFARPLGADILLENGVSQMASADRLRLFLSMTQLPLDLCFDSAAAHRTGDFSSEFDKMKDGIRLLHLADPDEDQRRLPMLLDDNTIDDAIDWPAAAELFATLAKPPEAVLDADDPDTDDPDSAADPLDAARESFRRLENLLDG